MSSGEVSEWLKEHAWKVCIRVNVSRVRIPLSPPNLLRTPTNDCRVRSNKLVGHKQRYRLAGPRRLAAGLAPGLALPPRFDVGLRPRLTVSNSNRNWASACFGNATPATSYR